MDCFDVTLENGSVYRTDYVFLATGYGSRNATSTDREYADFVRDCACRNARLGYFPTAYPIDNLDNVNAGATVAIQGFGLTAHDVISGLTLGRGGKYVEHDGTLHYQRSGKEPLILLFSRNCLPFAARGINQKGLTGRHIARFFTVSHYADVLVIARIDAYFPLTDGSALTANLVEQGVIRPYLNGHCHPGGIDVDPDLHPIDIDGKAHTRMWAIGFAHARFGPIDHERSDSAVASSNHAVPAARPPG